MEVYTPLTEAARKAKMGVETLKRACEEGLIKASQLPNSIWFHLSLLVRQRFGSFSLPLRELGIFYCEAM